MAEAVSNKLQLMLKCPKFPVKPTSELSAIMQSGVPMDFLTGTLKKNNKTGTMIKPPPEPTKPVKNPTIMASKITK